MLDSVTLVVPADVRYRTLVPELAGKYVEIAGGSTADVDAVAHALSTALAELAGQVAADAAVDLIFNIRRGGVDITLKSGGRSLVVTHSLTAVKR